MSRKLDFIPKFNNYQEVLKWMDDDFNYRKEERTEKTIFGNPLYYRINCQVIVDAWINIFKNDFDEKDNRKGLGE